MGIVDYDDHNALWIALPSTIRPKNMGSKILEAFDLGFPKIQALI